MKSLAIVGIVISAIGITLGVHNIYDSFNFFNDFSDHFAFHHDLLKPLHGGVMSGICGFFLAFSIIVLKKCNKPGNGGAGFQGGTR